MSIKTEPWGIPKAQAPFPTDINQQTCTETALYFWVSTQTRAISILREFLQGIPTYPRESPLNSGNPHLPREFQFLLLTCLMCFLYPHSQWTRWDACDYWQTPHNRAEWHINTFCCSEPHSFVQCKVRKSFFFQRVGCGNSELNKQSEWLQLQGINKNTFCLHPWQVDIQLFHWWKYQPLTISAH